jgi:hypothetical protein
VPLENENRWTGLLAVLISTGAVAVAAPLGLGDVAGHEISVQREFRSGRHERVDLLIYVDGKLHTVVEVKVLSSLGYAQLARYSGSFPGAVHYLLLYPTRLIIHPGSASQWHGLTWEDLLTAFAGSLHPWVAETASAWLEHLARALPELDPDIRWNAVPKGENYALAMRARMSWVYSRLQPTPPVTSDLMQSGGSKARVTRLLAPAARDGYVVGGEAEPRGARNWPLTGTTEPNPSVGPSVLIGLHQHNVRDSASFDWDYLHSMWPTMASARSDWVAGRPGLPNATDKQNWRRIGSPPTLGYGFGGNWAAKTGSCLFGAKFQLRVCCRFG